MPVVIIRQVKNIVNFSFLYKYKEIHIQECLAEKENEALVALLTH